MNCHGAVAVGVYKKELVMVGIMMALVCVMMALINLPGMLNGIVMSTVAFYFCLACAGLNIILGIRSFGN